jgi:GMP synthase-like glutamine amidotransferase
MPDVLILQHADWEVTGAYGAMLAERRLQGHVVRPDLGERLPDVRGFAAVIAMGGPMSVNDDLRWLPAEKRLIADAISADIPYFGTCLGAQLLAAALGARVVKDGPPEYGLQPVSITPEGAGDPLFAGLPESLSVFQWHGETFELPAGGICLARSDDYPNQAFRIGRRAYGLQFHLEVTPELLDTWLAVPQCRDEARQHLGHDADEQLTKQVRTSGDQLLGVARHVFDRWLAAVGNGPR